ncbi:CmpA/NrtA family ABC transporter substrate-binding protein [Neptuniibacter sp. QD48_11]|uniref:CmpA/NrtA family ABC transporter substrate-binding protein n=1 Tax=unclassified Neptuniibacter TaxID=2630693 RepID=UPI0039F58CBD
MSEALTLEKTDLKLGFVALLDCTPLVVAREKGFFKKHGLNVILSKESSWASIRDKVSFGLFDAAHMLAPMPLAATLGLNGNPTPMMTALSLSQNGTAITLSQELYIALSNKISDWDDCEQVGQQFKELIQQSGRKPVIATVYPYSNHHYQLRFWLNQNNINTEEDVQLVAVPPTKMLDNLSTGLIDGYCVGEPWNSLALVQQIGGLVSTGHKIWGSHMEKVLGVTQQWADQHPNTHRALIKALHEACLWAEDPSNQAEILKLLALPPYLDQAAEQLSKFTPPYSMEQHFSGENVNCPDPDHGLFLIDQMRKCGQIGEQAFDQDEIVHNVYRKDLYHDWIGA